MVVDEPGAEDEIVERLAVPDSVDSDDKKKEKCNLKPKDHFSQYFLSSLDIFYVENNFFGLNIGCNLRNNEMGPTRIQDLILIF